MAVPASTAELVAKCTLLERENAQLKQQSASTSFVLNWVAESSRKQKAGCTHFNPSAEGLCNENCLASLAIFTPQRILREAEGALEWTIKDPSFDIKALLEDPMKVDSLKNKMEHAFFCNVSKKHPHADNLKNRDHSMIHMCGLDKRADGKFNSLLITLDCPEMYIQECSTELGSVKVNVDSHDATALLVRRCKVCKSVVASREVGHCERCRKPLEDYMRWFMEQHNNRRPQDWNEFRAAVLQGKLKEKCGGAKACNVTHTVRQCLIGDKANFSPRCGVTKHHIVDGRMCQECRFMKSADIFQLGSLLAASHSGSGTTPRGKKRKAETESEGGATFLPGAQTDMDTAPVPQPVVTKIAATVDARAVIEPPVPGPVPAEALPLESVLVPTPTAVPIAAMLTQAPTDDAAAKRAARPKVTTGVKGAPNAQLDLLAMAAGGRTHE